VIGTPKYSALLDKHHAAPSSDPGTPTHEGVNVPTAGTQTSDMDERKANLTDAVVAVPKVITPVSCS